MKCIVFAIVAFLSAGTAVAQQPKITEQGADGKWKYRGAPDELCQGLKRVSGDVTDQAECMAARRPGGWEKPSPEDVRHWETRLRRLDAKCGETHPAISTVIYELQDHLATGRKARAGRNEDVGPTLREAAELLDSSLPPHETPTLGNCKHQSAVIQGRERKGEPPLVRDPAARLNP